MAVTQLFLSDFGKTLETAHSDMDPHIDTTVLVTQILLGSAWGIMIASMIAMLTRSTALVWVPWALPHRPVASEPPRL